MQSITQCPICEGNSFKHYLTCKDHTVSHETFNLIKCDTCDFVITSPRPDNRELGKYYLSEDYISHSKKARGLFDKVYKISRLFTLKWKLNLVKNNVKEHNHKLNLLDFGCGTGEFLEKCKAEGFNVQGVEPSDSARKNAEVLIGKDLYKTLDYTTGPFDIITLWHVLEHIPDLNEIIRQLSAQLKENGTMFIAVPNHRSKDAQHYKNEWAGYDVPRHLWHFSDTNMKHLLRKHALKVTIIIPMKLDAFYVSMLSEKHRNGTNGPMQMTKGFLSGLKSNLQGRNNNQYSSLIYVVRK